MTDHLQEFLEKNKKKAEIRKNYALKHNIDINESHYITLELKYKIIFHAPVNKLAREIQVLFLHQVPPDICRENEWDFPIMFDVLKNLNNRTQKNYYRIISYFDYKFKDVEWVNVYVGTPDDVFKAALGLFLGRFPNKNINLLNGKLRSELNIFYKQNKKSLKKNRFTNEFLELFRKSEDSFYDSRGIYYEYYQYLESNNYEIDVKIM